MVLLIWTIVHSSLD
uniref:Uncharacterized protein n=1 Tax=Rhizophora mucronata TaxID=61149 RepID=A0A2P2NKW0_RHIMU